MKNPPLAARLTLTGAFFATLLSAACTVNTVPGPAETEGTPPSVVHAGDASVPVGQPHRPPTRPRAHATAPKPPKTPQADGGSAPTTPTIAIADFAATVASHMCDAAARCCIGDGGAPAENIDRPLCEAVYLQVGFESSNEGEALFAGGNVAIDQAKATACLAKIDGFACMLNGDGLEDVRSTCFGRSHRPRSLGRCVRIERRVRPRPLLLADGRQLVRRATCAPLKTEGEPCNMFTGDEPWNNAMKAEEACSYRGGGGTGLHCNSLDVNGNYTAEATWTCSPVVAESEMCNSTVWCASGICDPDTYACTSPTSYFTSYSCDALMSAP